MPTSIPSRQLNRIFPFEFYNELFKNFNEYIPALEPFQLKLAMNITSDNESSTNSETLQALLAGDKEIFEHSLSENKEIIKEIRTQNIVELGLPFPMVSLMPYLSKNDLEQNTLNNPSILLVQYFDQNQKPYFTEELPLEILRLTPEINYHDPNIAIGIFEGTTKRTFLIKLPKFVNQQFIDQYLALNKELPHDFKN